jgi:hypothetical protein
MIVLAGQQLYIKAAATLPAAALQQHDRDLQALRGSHYALSPSALNLALLEKFASELGSIVDKLCDTLCPSSPSSPAVPTPPTLGVLKPSPPTAPPPSTLDLNIIIVSDDEDDVIEVDPADFQKARPRLDESVFDPDAIEWDLNVVEVDI